MLKSDLQPPRNGLNADPILYGVAAGLAELFPPIDPPRPRQGSDGLEADAEHPASGEGGRE
jgi:hypothetical protein